MDKKDQFINVIKMQLGLIEKSDSFCEATKDMPKELKQQSDLIANLLSGMSDDMKIMILNLIETSIDVAVKQNGYSFKAEDVQKNIMGILAMTDPNNKISPFSIKDTNKN